MNFLTKFAQQQKSRIRKLRQEYVKKLRIAKKQHQAEIQKLYQQYEQEVQNMKDEIESLTNDINFQKEMNTAQRIMLEDAFLQCKKLQAELKIRS